MIDFCVLGSGVSGSTIANLLNKRYKVLLLDKAQGIGGRASNKTYKSNISFDHGLQYFSPKEKNFNKLINQLHKNKILKIWEGPHLDLGFGYEKKKFIGRNTNNDLNKFFLKKIKKIFNCEIKSISYNGKYWILYNNKRTIQAKNLIITFPYNQVINLAKKYLSKKILRLKVKMQPNITLMVTEKNKNKIPFSSLKLENSIISWIANENSKKRFKCHENLWTIQTNKKFSDKIINTYKKNKIKFSNIILKEFSNILGIKYKSLKVFRIHGWKYSYSNSSTNINSYWNSKYKLGICGDWFLGPKAEHAWTSANKLFDRIKKNPPKIRRV